ncbi:extracellular catalytic domain type 1 short-chain-length polyhydroxyalkanoate depolymerase [Blastochloris tepida]|uniref:Esterase n=1 Tax=Blastochloris tepida TaxID=2233851 RepID=A0A348G3N4_9HYPH|nr:PHB depolymerase family esterase [Blastochloris tepida]BBF94167.1 esterase [Blastochloris tepida]
MPLRGLEDLAAGLAAQRRKWLGLDGQPLVPRPPLPTGSRLVEIRDFGSNPGRLRMFVHVPAGLAERPGLVVVLHGCTQNAAAYDIGAGWSTLADRYGFVVLAPEQTRLNNPRNCFNWFRSSDIRRDRGECASIRQMVERIILDHDLDRQRVFVTGLSAGGAMTSVMLATYPEVFAAGAVIAGLPYGCADGVPQALEAMKGGRTRPARDWGDLVRAASRHRGPWPRVAVWHGDADDVVAPLNAGEITKQWTDLHGLPDAPDATDRLDGHPRRLWHGPGGEVMIEDVLVEGMAHGTPLAIKGVEAPHGAAGPFLLDVGIASSFHIAKFFGLTGEVTLHPASRTGERPPPPEALPGVSGTIARALRAAGLWRR